MSWHFSLLAPSTLLKSVLPGAVCFLTCLFQMQHALASLVGMRRSTLQTRSWFCILLKGRCKRFLLTDLAWVRSIFLLNFTNFGYDALTSVRLGAWATGQGVMGYITGTQSLPRNSESKGWSIDTDKNLWFNNQSLVACPNSIDGSWSLWLDVSLSQPGGNEGCLGITARTLENEEPVSCLYTQ